MDNAVEAWRNLLAEVPDSASWVQKQFDRMPEFGMMYLGKSAVEVAEPVFVTQSQVDADEVVASSVVDCLMAAGTMCLQTPEVADRFMRGWLADGPDADLFNLPAGYPNPVVFGRLDGVRTPDGLRILEFNGGLPGGVLPADGSAALLSRTDVADQFARTHAFRTATAGEAVVSALVSTWHDFGGTGLPFVAVALPRELTAFAAGGIDYLGGIAQARGIELVVVDPGEMVFSDCRLRVSGRPVDVLVRAFFTPMFSYLGQRLDGIKAALRDGSVCMIASLQSGLFGLKSLFALVTDPAIDLDVSPQALQRAREALPWTRLIEDTETTDFEGDTVSLVRLLAARREDLVIKPVEGYGGAGVELGWNHTDESWAAVINHALAGAHVAQRRIPILGEEFSVLEAGFPVRRFLADHNPLVCAGKLAGYYVRLASDTSGMTNVTGGGASVAPTFILDGG
jgi:hypothetical protein